MRMNIAFDTHAYVKRLIAAGVPEAQAEVQAEALSEIALANLATKDDLREGLRSVREDLRSLEERMNTKLESELRKQMLWFFAAQVALFGALVALFKLV
jgi:dsDNA-specific endonuclease/ATPase MutS2